MDTRGIQRVESGTIGRDGSGVYRGPVRLLSVPKIITLMTFGVKLHYDYLICDHCYPSK